jgi:hypothetical protein
LLSGPWASSLSAFSSSARPFSDWAGRKAADLGRIRTETVAKRKCSGRIAKCAERYPAESERSKAIGDSGPTNNTWEPAGRQSDSKASRGSLVLPLIRIVGTRIIRIVWIVGIGIRKAETDWESEAYEDRIGPEKTVIGKKAIIREETAVNEKAIIGEK